MNLDAIGVVAKDIDRALKFYKVFGFEFSKIGEGHYEAVTENGVRLMLDSAELMQKINSDWSYQAGSNITLCHKVTQALEVDVLYKKIVEAGYDKVKEPWDAFWKQRYASVQDPDGNQIDIFADL